MQNEIVQIFVQTGCGTLPPPGASRLDSYSASTIGRTATASAHYAVLPVESETEHVDRERERLHDIFSVMSAAPKRVSATEARQSLAELVRWTSETQRPIIIGNHGKPEAVLISFSTFERVLKSLARVVLGVHRRRSSLTRRAEELLENDAVALNRRLRERAALS